MPERRCSSGARSGTIGGTTPAAANVVSGNGLCSLGDCTGVAINIGLGSGTLIAGNYVGTTANGAAKLKNLATGVVILTAGNTLGKTGAGNVISANGGDGVLVGASSTVISGNMIGTNAAGTAGLGNVSHGIDDQGSNITITGNVISANGDTGLVLFGNDIVQGNFIGTSAAGTVALGNGLNPSVIFNGQPINGTDGITTCGGSNTIGGTAPGTGNVISANGGNGISLVSNSNVVQGNTIGTNGAGTAALPNLVDGIGFGGEFTQGTGFCQQAPDVGGSSNTIGGTASGAGNTISGNAAFGIKIIKGTSNLVQGNRIGTTASGAALLGNGSDGVALQAFCDDGVCSPSSSNTIGGTASGAGNIISGNGGNGISVDGTGGGTSNTVQGNHVGTDAGGTIALGNKKNGVILDNGAVNDLVGGTAGGAANTIANNGQAGVQIGSAASDTGTHSPVQQNSIFNNLGLGIDLAPLGTVNCTTSPPGPNDYTACPVITSATTSQIRGTACSGCTVEAYIATGEGKTLLGSVTADAGGSWSLTLAPGRSRQASR